MLLLLVAFGSEALAQPAGTRGRPAAKQQGVKERSAKSFQRDVRQLRKVKATTDLSSLLTSKSKLTGKLATDVAPWANMKEGQQQFKFELGNGVVLHAGAGRYDLPAALGGTRFKLHTLSLGRGDTSRSLVGKDDISISLGRSTNYNYHHSRISWRGPESRFSVLALLHELGHARDFKNSSEAQHADYADAYDRIANQQMLSDRQHRQLIGLERSAWAYALKTARSLKKEGFDVLQGVGTRELSEVIKSSLKGYYDYQGVSP